MTEYLLILVATVFVNNIVMVKILGLCPFMGVSRKLEAAIGMGAATTFVLTLASGASYLINEYLLGPELAYLSALVQEMRKTQQTARYIQSMGPFFVGRVAWQSPLAGAV